jgi:hypothetical protein
VGSLSHAAHEKELKKRLQEVSDQLQIRERGTYSHSYYEGGAARHQELETELYDLRKTIKAEVSVRVWHGATENGP